MENTDDIRMLVSRYLNESLSDDEQKGFEARCLNDPAFADAVKVEIKAQYAERSIVNEGLKSNFSGLFKEFSEEKKSRRPAWVRYWVPAAAVLLLLLLFLPRTISYFTAPPTTGDLYSAYYTHLDPPSTRSGNISADSLWLRAASTYAEGDYETALQNLTLLNQSGDYAFPSRIQLYAGLSYLMQENYPSAIAAFNAVDPNSNNYQDAQWYLGLAYLKSEDANSAKIVFRSISNQGNHYKSKEATEILSKL